MVCLFLSPVHCHVPPYAYVLWHSHVTAPHARPSSDCEARTRSVRWSRRDTAATSPTLQLSGIACRVCLAQHALLAVSDWVSETAEGGAADWTVERLRVRAVCGLWPGPISSCGLFLAVPSNNGIPPNMPQYNVISKTRTFKMEAKIFILKVSRPE